MKLSGIVITKNSEEKLETALKSLKGFVDEIVVADGGSTDRTLAIAKKYGARIIKQTGKGYADWRNDGVRAARGEWIFYLDFDEETPANLQQEIKKTINAPESSAYAIPRKNIILGRVMKHGGWWPDYVKRLYKKSALRRWEGDLHEEPIFEGSIGHLKNPIIHYKHDHLSEMIKKTDKWSEIEARLLLESNHPQMTWWRFFRIMFTELLYRLFWKLGFLDGTEGVIYAIYQMFSKFITYGKLWEMQKHRYSQIKN